MRAPLLALALLAGAAPLAAPLGAQHAEHHPAPDTAFAALQARGRTYMGVDQSASTHHFDTLADGGRIALESDRGDSAAVATIRAHMRSIAAALARGDFATPGLVHGKTVPGTAVMAGRRAAIAYEARDLPRGAEVRIHTADPAARRAVAEFMAFQRGEHHAGGAPR